MSAVEPAIFKNTGNNLKRVLLKARAPTEASVTEGLLLCTHARPCHAGDDLELAQIHQVYLSLIYMKAFLASGEIGSS